MVIGLTGGIGCGKSAASAFFAEAGFQVIDADQLARQALESAGCVSAMTARWGVACLDRAGHPDRAWIAAKVFSDEAERGFLESLTHPEVARLRRELLDRHKGDSVVEIPLLFEKNLNGDFSAVVCVASSDAVRVARLIARGMSAEQIAARIKSQLPLLEKVKRSDFVIWNDGDMATLRHQVTELIARLRGTEIPQVSA
jgi:dephospho-CoA kinase